MADMKYRTRNGKRVLMHDRKPFVVYYEYDKDNEIKPLASRKCINQPVYPSRQESAWRSLFAEVCYSLDDNRMADSYMNTPEDQIKPNKVRAYAPLVYKTSQEQLNEAIEILTTLTK